MNKTLKSNRQSTLQFVIVFGAFCLFVNLLETYTRIEELHWSLELISKLALIIALSILLNFGEEVRIKNSKIIKGNYNQIYGFIKIKSQLNIENITDIIVVENSEKHFEVKVLASEGEMIIDSLPNRYPANLELERVKEIIKTAANSSL